ncbi:AAA family ATPase [Marinobacterium maritimum]|uniref:AAA family ATPase n=1 Tax=Marinobacterium maritimum TaxID=500162 RepID=A0ABP3TCF3_9GAMM
MRFFLERYFPDSGKNSAHLVINNWDDFGFETLFNLIVFDKESNRYEIGAVKIAYKGQISPSATRDSLEQNFESLGGMFFSLGQDEEYYNAIRNLPGDLSGKILSALNDLVYKKELIGAINKENVFVTSLTRFVSEKSIKENMRNVYFSFFGEKEKENFEFYIESKKNNLKMSFGSEENSIIPTNIHVLIGSNGVGKSYLIDSISKILLEQEGYDLSIYDEKGNLDIFSGVITISFSALDSFLPLAEDTIEAKRCRYTYIGLKKPVSLGGNSSSLLTNEEIREVFIKDLEACVVSGKKYKIERALYFLSSDQIFNKYREDLMGIMNSPGVNENIDISKARKLLNELSSGHFIVLLMMVGLIRKIEKSTLVLIDEPETHLHPPLLSAFIRSLSDLLSSVNAIAICATHSPVILQEVPMNCVWRLKRHGSIIKAHRPTMETFGENVGTLTRDVFGLEVEKSGFYKFVEDNLDIMVSSRLKSKLGSEAMSIYYALDDKDF